MIEILARDELRPDEFIRFRTILEKVWVRVAYMRAGHWNNRINPALFKQLQLVGLKRLMVTNNSSDIIRTNAEAILPLPCFGSSGDVAASVACGAWETESVMDGEILHVSGDSHE